ncbi:unnamed protein product [Polarella glacialis]|uniref:Uncharacterized protein n=1 Tax=Polarella glacialis TaxID=89957 RepID=A0A813HRY1_POLGL|nr:unnamed protein product [Polarella glacialis]CAE8640923.1 unnamed protein product [Polarella glacialis]
MSNIHMAQARLFHKQQLAISQAGLFRDDVRELIQAVTTVFRNEAIVCTLLVGVAGGTYRGHMVPPGIGIPTLVEQLYLLSLSTSIAYGVMGMLFALSGINMATECRKELLTTVMRLPIRDILREVEDAVVNESAETFESQEFRQMFRAPLLDQMLKGRKSEQAVSDEVRPSDIAQSKMMQSEHDKVIVAVETQYNLVKNMFQEKERQWTALERISGNFLFLSIAYTLNAFGGIAISEYYKHYDISFFVAHGFFITIEAIIVYFANIRYKCSTHHNFFEMFLILAQAPVIYLAILLPDSSWWMTALCKSIQIGLAILFNRKTSSRGSYSLKWSSYTQDESAASSTSSSSEDEEHKRRPNLAFSVNPDGTGDVIVMMHRVRLMVFMSIVVAWLVSFLLSELHWRHVDPGGFLSHSTFRQTVFSPQDADSPLLRSKGQELHLFQKPGS